MIWRFLDDSDQVEMWCHEHWEKAGIVLNGSGKPLLVANLFLITNSRSCVQGM